MTTETKTQKLRALLSAEGCHDVLGCHDAMSAKLIEEAKFPVAYFSGFAFSASRLAMPDVGVATYSEMVEAARACCAATSIPIVGDGDTGYGGLLNVRRTVEGYAAAGKPPFSVTALLFTDENSDIHGERQGLQASASRTRPSQSDAPTQRARRLCRLKRQLNASRQPWQHVMRSEHVGAEATS